MRVLQSRQCSRRASRSHSYASKYSSSTRTGQTGGKQLFSLAYARVPCPSEKVVPPQQMLTRERALRYQHLKHHQPTGIPKLRSLSRREDPTRAKILARMQARERKEEAKRMKAAATEESELQAKEAERQERRMSRLPSIRESFVAGVGSTDTDDKKGRESGRRESRRVSLRPMGASKPVAAQRRPTSKPAMSKRLSLRQMDARLGMPAVTSPSHRRPSKPTVTSPSHRRPSSRPGPGVTPPTYERYQRQVRWYEEYEEDSCEDEVGQFAFLSQWSTKKSGGGGNRSKEKKRLQYLR
mmetsp:Transcript_1225/g.2186  ORF Transcript_1225/g.2186 Transcript_1225/m.2186 type:complete len:297 (+) Transcript_1225:3085-3975(+)